MLIHRRGLFGIQMGLVIIFTELTRGENSVA